MANVTQIFPSFAAARAACGTGYDDGDIADVIAYKTALPVDPRQLMPEQATNSILALGLTAAEVTERPLKVLDFGGGCGFHFLRVAAAMHTPLQWAIVETPTMAERANKIAQGRFQVFTDISGAAEALGRIDLVHASSSIQYAPEPRDTLRTLAALHPRYLTLARLPVWGLAQIVGLQIAPLYAHGIGPMPPHIADREVAYPITFINFDDVMKILAEYEIAMSISSPSSTYTVRGQKVLSISVIFRAKEIRAATTSGRSLKLGGEN